MSRRVQDNVKVPSGTAPSFAPVQSGLLERKSLLGGAPGLADGFIDSRRKRLVSQPPLVQTKLTINQPNDRYEQEANRVVEQVMRMSEPEVQRQVKGNVPTFALANSSRSHPRHTCGKYIDIVSP